METKKQKTSVGHIGGDFFERLWEESWVYIKTVVDIVREPVLILDKELRVIAANEPFYRTFQVDVKDTQDRVVYKLGNGQWDIPSLRKLLEDILPKNSFFKGYEVDHDFPVIGHKIMILNARQIRFNNAVTPHIILLAMEDVTEMMNVAKTLSEHTLSFQSELTERTQNLEMQISLLKKEMEYMKKKKKIAV
jgi:nitrogen-specific signal transduction histidine kinase